MDDRKSAILRAVVEQYIATNEPVGSARVAKATDLGVSPATVRSEMAALELEGFLVQPHTSAGRIPTDMGYRHYVDTVTEPGQLDQTQVRRVRSFFAHAHGELERMLRETSDLLADLTDMAAVVVAPTTETVTVRSCQLVRLTDSVALVVLVHANGVVEKHTVEPGDPLDDAVVERAGRALSDSVLNRTVATARPLAPTGDERADALAVVALASMRSDPHELETVFVGGAARVADRFEAVETVSRVLNILEQQLVVVSLLNDVLARGLRVAIGAETGLEPLSECSLVVAPYGVDGVTAGTIGVLGPTRMNYPDALAAVAVVSTRLGRSLADSSG